MKSGPQTKNWPYGVGLIGTISMPAVMTILFGLASWQLHIAIPAVMTIVTYGFHQVISMMVVAVDLVGVKETYFIFAHLMSCHLYLVYTFELKTHNILLMWIMRTI